MNTTILIPMTRVQLHLLIEAHYWHAARAPTLAEAREHQRHAADLQRRLTDHDQRTEAPA